MNKPRSLLELLAGIFYVPAVLGGVLGLSHLILAHHKSPYLVNIVFLLALLGGLEQFIAFKDVSYKKKNLITDALFIVINPILMPVLFIVCTHALHPPRIHVASSLLAQSVFVFVFCEFLRYWAHRWQHEVPLLWRFHAVHHSTKELYFLNQFISHPLDYLFRNVLTFAPMIFFDVSLEAIAYAQAVSITFAMLAHGNVKIKNGFWNYIFSTNDLHRWHHSVLPAEADHNYGVATTIWDQLFGTFFWPKDRENTVYGIENDAYDAADLAGLMKAPFISNS